MTTLNAFLDLQVCPASFDAVVFMVKADIERRKINATRMHVVMVGPLRLKPQYDEAEAAFRFWNIVVPAVQLFGATFTYATDWLQAERLASTKEWKNWPNGWRNQSLKNRQHLIGGVIDSAKAGVEVIRLQASVHARKKVRELYAKARLPVVTMTLRSTYIKERNSDPKEWDEARRYIENKGYAVAVLQDTNVAMSRGSGFGELNLDIRMALYQEACMNLHSNGGAASLSWFSTTPYLMFGAGIPADEWDGLFVRQNLPLGQTWPWSLPGQKLVYRQPSRAIICEEFDEWVKEQRP